MKIANVYSGAAADKAGLHVGDVIYSSNGYLTQVHGNLAWIIDHAAPNKVLTMRVSTGSRRQGACHHGPTPLIG